MTLPRRHSDRGLVLDYRHVIDHLLRKPGAFERYRYREQLFPGPVFRQAHDQLVAQKGQRRGVMEYLQLLKLTSEVKQTDVEVMLADFTSPPFPAWSVEELRRTLSRQPGPNSQWRSCNRNGTPMTPCWTAGRRWFVTAEGLPLLLRSFGLTTMAGMWEETLACAERENWGYARLVRQLCESEAQDRRERRTQRLLKTARLPDGKTLGNLDEKLLPAKLRRRLPTLLEGHFVGRAENVLAFGLPGRGKTHFLAALGRELILRHDRTVLFTPTYKLVQQLLAANRNCGWKPNCGSWIVMRW